MFTIIVQTPDFMSVAVVAAPKTSGTRFVSKQEFDACLKECSRPREGCIMLTTSEDDVRQTEEMLGVPAGSLQNHNFSIQTEQSHCQHCNRQTSWLDIIASATSAHSKAFLARMLLAEDKYMVTDVVPPLSCFNCKQPITAPSSYTCKGYSCGSN
jgi:hypothetical protein